MDTNVSKSPKVLLHSYVDHHVSWANKIKLSIWSAIQPKLVIKHYYADIYRLASSEFQYFMNLVSAVTGAS